MAFGGGPHQRRRLLELLRRVDVDAAREQQRARRERCRSAPRPSAASRLRDARATDWRPPAAAGPPSRRRRCGSRASSGVTPKSLATSTVALAAISARAISTLELWAAQSSGVDPSPDRALTSAPDLMSARTAWTSPALTALVSGLSPLAPATATNTRHCQETHRTPRHDAIHQVTPRYASKILTYQGFRNAPIRSNLRIAKHTDAQACVSPEWGTRSRSGAPYWLWRVRALCPSGPAASMIGRHTLKSQRVRRFLIRERVTVISLPGIPPGQHPHDAAADGKDGRNLPTSMRGPQRIRPRRFAEMVTTRSLATTGDGRSRLRTGRLAKLIA